ncbi:uncharacterized protein LOC135393410 isoform X1 [Ornithodoros turicata]|uniref:uncharacterized protein LOC135393410 isoform X1 n=1 Tax=Ornithodoros turicata TaxID=34597 RepID=UPI00313A4066
MGSEGMAVFFVLFFCHVVCKVQETASRSVHNSDRNPELPSDNVRLGVYAVVDDSIGNKSATLEDYKFYVAGLVAGVNINLMELSQPIIRLGLLGVYNLTEEQKKRMSPNQKIDLNGTWAVIQEIKEEKLRANESDIIYVFTKNTITSGGVDVQGTASVRGACTEDNIAVGNDHLWSYGGFKIFLRNIAALLGGLSFECDANSNNFFDECRKKHMMSHLRKLWPYCYGHSTQSPWILSSNIPGDRIEKNDFCEFKMSRKGAKECTQQNIPMANNTDQPCEIECCLPGEGKGGNNRTYVLPVGSTCRTANYDVYRRSCYKKECKGRLPLQLNASPGDSRRYPLNFTWLPTV